MGADGYVRLGDFGNSQLLGSACPAASPEVTSICGDYLAPELLDAHTANFIADWWSVGVLTYELLTGT